LSVFINKRIGRLLKTRSTGWIAKSAGIPKVSVYLHKFGIKELSTKWTANVRSLWQRESYLTMRNKGFSSFQAGRFRPLSPAGLDAKIGLFDNKVNELARGYAVKRIGTLGLKETESNIKRFMPAGAKKVRQGMYYSKQPFEVWMDYGKV